MQEEHRKAIQNNFVTLVEQTDLDVMVSALFEKGVFSEQMIEPYKDSNKDLRNRKRDLYRDITRRGPLAFGLLLETLTEVGCWDLVRDLDPNSSLHGRQNRSNISTQNNAESQFVSIKTEKKRKEILNVPPPPSLRPELPDPEPEPTQFHVHKSTRFIEADEKGLKLYRTRSRNRGILVVFSYITFQHNSETHRPGVDIDCNNLKNLFIEIGFKVLSYKDLTMQVTMDTLLHLRKVLVDTESVFIVVSSHGYERFGTSDNDIRCSDGKLVSVHTIIDNFNNGNCPDLVGIPKVFVFQICRGQKADQLGALRDCHDGSLAPARADERDAAPEPPPRRPTHRPGSRLKSDVLIAHSTLPGYVSHRNELRGSWYIQALCEVFAERAHDCHVELLFTLVDERLAERFGAQTSSVDRWGFNQLLYLHPGLFED